MFLAAFIVSQKGGRYFAPRKLDVEANSEETRKKRFDGVRRKIDPNTKGEYRLFKGRQEAGSRKYEYRFVPGEDVRWCVILPIGVKA